MLYTKGSTSDRVPCPGRIKEHEPPPELGGYELRLRREETNVDGKGREVLPEDYEVTWHHRGSRDLYLLPFVSKHSGKFGHLEGGRREGRRTRNTGSRMRGGHRILG